MAKFYVVFLSEHKKRFLYRRHFKTNGNSTGSSKNGTRDFQNGPVC